MKSSSKTSLPIHCLLFLSFGSDTAFGQQKIPVLKSSPVENQAVPTSKIRFVAGNKGDLIGKKKSFIKMLVSTETTIVMR